MNMIWPLNEISQYVKYSATYTQSDWGNYNTKFTLICWF